jgi:Protein kinase domain
MAFWRRRLPPNDPLLRLRSRSLQLVFLLGLFLPNAIVLKTLLSIHPRIFWTQIPPSAPRLLSSPFSAGIEVRASGFARSGNANGRVECPSRGLPERNHAPMHQPDYGRLDVTPWLGLNQTTTAAQPVDFKWDAGRVIRPNDSDMYHNARNQMLDTLDEETDWWDTQFEHWEERDYPKRKGPQCYEPKWTMERRQSCNAFHETVLFERQAKVDPHHTFDFQYLARGAFRLSFLFTDMSPARDDFVVKPVRLIKDEDRPYDPFTFDTVGIEALAMERTAASDRTIDMYGFCGGSVLLEPGRTIFQKLRPRKFFVSQEEMDRRHPNNAVPYNNLTSPEKLMISLAMAEGLAELHGDKGGVLVNRDVQIEQFVVSRRTGKIKLVDFNNVVPLKWNVETNEYCPYKTSFNFVYRSPEELTHTETDESSDVYALGQVMYTILTGMLPYYSAGSYWKAIEQNKKGKTPYLDPRYRRKGVVESRLMDIMKRTWNKDRFARPSIFEVVQHLRDTIHMYEEQHNTYIANMTFHELAERNF